MLSSQARAIVTSTIPLLETGGEALTTHFYRIMLTEYPEVRPLFNQAHQASGDQARALANGILTYARHLDRLDALGPMVGRIVAKHVALQILPEHYPIVGACLLRAIREVLGEEIATDEVIAAWADAYQQLSSLLIAAEEEVYAANAESEGGWRGGRRFVVRQKVVESEEITSFYLAPADGGPVQAFIPGQFIGLRLDINGQEVRRNYSLSAAPNGRDYRISVKREPNGKVSNHLHDRVGEGDALELFAPAGDFILRPGRKPLVLISAGVGITPALAMLEAAHASGRPIHFIHCARNASVQAFRPWLAEMAARTPNLRLHTCLSEPNAGDRADATGLLSRDQLAQWLPASRDVEAYFLGPKPFMAMVKKHLAALGVPAAQCHYEFFGPAAELDA